MSKFQKYKRVSISEMRHYIEGEVLDSHVSISEADLKAGSPKLGDMIARNPKNHDDQWLVNAAHYAENFVGPINLKNEKKITLIDLENYADQYIQGRYKMLDPTIWENEMKSDRKLFLEGMRFIYDML